MEASLSFYPDGPNEGGIGVTSHADATAVVKGDAYVLRVANDEADVTIAMSLDELKKLLAAWGL